MGCGRWCAQGNLRWRDYMRKGSILLLAGALVLVASLIVGPAANAKSSAPAAGTVVFGHDQEPSTLNQFITAGNNYPTPLTMQQVGEGQGVYDNHAKIVPFLGDGPAKILKNDPLPVT